MAKISIASFFVSSAMVARLSRLLPCRALCWLKNTSMEQGINKEEIVFFKKFYVNLYLFNITENQTRLNMTFFSLTHSTQKTQLSAEVIGEIVTLTLTKEKLYK